MGQVLDPTLVALVNQRAYAALQTPRRNTGSTGYEWGTPGWLDQSQTWAAVQTFTPAARSSGSSPYLVVNAPADTSLTASTEAIGVSFVGATRQHATGALATQREYVFGAPTYSFAGASTITTAATVEIAGPPVAGTNCTITNAPALRLASGYLMFGSVSGLKSNNTAGLNLVEVTTPAGAAGGGFYSSTMMLCGTSGTIGLTDLSQYTQAMRGGVGFCLASGLQYTFSSSTTAATGSIDLALKRNAASVLEVNNGTAGRWGGVLCGHYGSETSSVVNGLTLGKRSSGTPAAGLGIGCLFNIDSSTTADQAAGLLSYEWVVATHASRTARGKLVAYDTAARECVRVEASGSEPMLGFYGVTAITRAVLATGAGATVDNVIQALQNLGLVKQS